MREEKSNIGTLLIISILLSFISGVLGSYFVMNTKTIGVVKNITTSELIETSIAPSVEKTYDAVVAVVAYKNGEKISTGTGFVYKKEKGKGYIMTNYHVIDGSDKVEVIFSNSETSEVTVLGGETYSDIAVLSIDESKILSIVEIGESAKVKLGDTVFTVGCPLGATYSGTVTKGILSGKERMVEVSYSGSVADYYVKVLQTDAAINPGNSGGPLFDVSGNVIGITSLKLVEEEVEGMGFAIPIEDALDYAAIFESGKKLSRPYLGISMVDVSQSLYLKQYKIDIPKDIKSGVVVLEVVDGSPAAKAGFAKGDIITSIGGKKVSSLAEFRYELYKHSVGENVEIVYLRNENESKTNVLLSEN